MTWADRFTLERAMQRETLPLASLLPYLMCGSVGDFAPLHLLEDGALGYALEFDVPAIDTEVDGEEALSGLIDQALRALPDAVQWQWFVQSSSFVEPQLQQYLEQSGRDPVGQICASHYVQRWRDAQRKGFFPQDISSNFFPRSQSILVALKSAPIEFGRTPMAAMLSRAAASDARAATFIEAARSLQATLATRAIAATALDADGLANRVADLLFPWRRFDQPAVCTGLHSVRETVHRWVESTRFRRGAFAP
jgi:hypothetical protein